MFWVAGQVALVHLPARTIATLALVATAAGAGALGTWRGHGNGGMHQLRGHTHVLGPPLHDPADGHVSNHVGTTRTQKDGKV